MEQNPAYSSPPPLGVSKLRAMLSEKGIAFAKELEKIAERIFSDDDVDKIARAYDMAEYAHEGYFRASGEPFIEHPKEVARILASLKVDTDSLVSALLHDTVEDSEGKVTIKDIEAVFGSEIARIVDGVTKVSKINAPVGNSKAREKLETIQKMLFAMAEDMRVIFVKLADRLHNMRTMKYLKSEEKKRYKALETLEIYAPIAHKLGIHVVQAELEDLAFKTLYPKEYYRMKELMSQKKRERAEKTEKYINMLKIALEEHGIPAMVDGRYKHYYSIWKKMKAKGKKFEEIYDLIAVRAVVRDEKTCYTSLGVVHSLWKPMPGRFKDYIAAPKSNGYRSLHTTVITQFGEPLEVQIRDERMHQEAEYGLISHWIYKENVDVTTKQKWIGMLLEWKKELSEGIMGIADVKKELVVDEVFVFTPKGEIKHLPKGSTPIDFAYSIHTEIGHHFAGAKVNGKLVPIDYELKNGDVIEIIVNRNSKGPSLDWIRYAKSPRTRAKIRKFLKEEYVVEMEEKGKETLRAISKRLGKSMDEILKTDKMKRFIDTNGLNERELLVRLGEGTISKELVLNVLVDTGTKKKGKRRKRRRLPRKPIVRIDGMEGLDVRMAKCCNPIPGDKIVAVVGKRGITIHRIGCRNIKGLPADRLFHAEWIEHIEGEFTAKIAVELENKGAIGKVMEKMEGFGVRVDKVELRDTEWGTVIFIIEMRVSGVGQMEDVMRGIKSSEKVVDVERVMG